MLVELWKQPKRRARSTGRRPRRPHPTWTASRGTIRWARRAKSAAFLPTRHGTHDRNLTVCGKTVAHEEGHGALAAGLPGLCAARRRTSSWCRRGVRFRTSPFVSRRRLAALLDGLHEDQNLVRERRRMVERRRKEREKRRLDEEAAAAAQAAMRALQPMSPTTELLHDVAPPHRRRRPPRPALSQRTRTTRHRRPTRASKSYWEASSPPN